MIKNTKPAWLPLFNWKWSKNNVGICFGITWNYWNSRGEKYLGVYILEIHFLNFKLTWFIAESLKNKGITEGSE